MCAMIHSINNTSKIGNFHDLLLTEHVAIRILFSAGIRYVRGDSKEQYGVILG